MIRRHDITGVKFGRLVVTENLGRDSGGNALWGCACECGGTAITRGFMLKTGRTKSCGCWYAETRPKKKPRIQVISKKCTSCKEIKVSSLFPKNKTHIDGLSSNCNKCKNVRYKQANAGATLAASTLRKKHVQIATPKWANRLDIKRLYDESACTTKITGIRHHVDHIIPLRGRMVCGLHVPKNLRVVPWHVNLQKGSQMADAEGKR